MRPRLIDLCCGAGAVSIGYWVAGWDVLGVDIEDQPHYPFPFLKADALSVERMLPFFDAVHASPPCLRDTVMKHAKGAKGDAHPEMIIPMRAMLQRSGKPYTIENVMGANLINPVILQGSMFKLGAVLSTGERLQLERKRKFETNWPLTAPVDHPCDDEVIGVYGAHVRRRAASGGGRKTADFPGEDKPRLMREAMGIGSHWKMTMAEMSQAVPPAYTQHVGYSLRQFLGA